MDGIMTDIKITTLEVSLNSAMPHEESHTNISKYKPPVLDKPKGRKYEAKDRITYGPFLEQMFFDNELEYYLTQPLSIKELKFKFLSAHKTNYTLKNKFKRYKYTIGMFRSKYNRRELYSTQDPVYLLSFDYNEAGYIVVDGRQYYRSLTFKQAYERCLEFKVADPRFIPHDKIVLLRDRKNSGDPQWADWSVPPDSFLDQLHRTVHRDSMYDTIEFPKFCTREETMQDDNS